MRLLSSAQAVAALCTALVVVKNGLGTTPMWVCSDIRLINEALSNGAGVLNAGRVAFAAHADGEAYARPILDNLERLSLMKLQAVNPGI
jgi:hypothetical protein